jgi:hypothetical protein
MEPVTRHLLSRALQAMGQATPSPLFAALCEGLSQSPSPVFEALYDQYCRIISATHYNLPVFLAALHHLALAGDAPSLARFFPSCGGLFRPGEDGPALVAAVDAVLRERREEVLDFLLTYEQRDPEVRRAAAVLLGALATVDRFGGGLSLVQLGAEDGLLLQFDRYAYAFGDQQLGESPLLLETSLSSLPWPDAQMPAPVDRRGLGRAPVDLLNPGERMVSEAFIPPDDLARLERFRRACPLACGADLRPGVPELDLPRLLVEAYNAMEPGNTLFLFSVLAWSQLDDEAQKRVAQGLQSLAAQVQPYKPIAWLQVEPFAPGSSTLELRLHTFGWADREDRAVRRLAEAAPDLSWIRWLE